MRSRRPLLAALALGLVAVGCDTADAPLEAADSVRLDVQAASTGDVLYDLAPLQRGETFDVALDVGVDDLTLRSTRTPAGYELAFVPGAMRPDSVVVSYYAHGLPVAEPFLALGDTMIAGSAAEGPDSWHYVWEDGSWTIAKDYNNNNMTNGDTTPFTLPSGEVVEVSDVTFKIYGVDAPAPSAVRFDAPTAVEVKAQAFGRPLR